VVTTLLPREMWLQVEVCKSIGAMYRSLLEALRQQSPLLAELRAPLTPQLMDPSDPAKKAKVETSRALRSLYWAQSEAVRVELEMNACTEDGGETDEAMTSSAANVLIWREPPFFFAFEGAGRAWAGEANKAAGAEEEPLSAAIKRIGPAVGGCEGERRTVAHRPPRLLRKSRCSRQFEFHPSLPDVLLVGDVAGYANVLSIGDEGEEEKEEEASGHPPLVVSAHPLLALAWMRQHPQVAICGSACSGDIVFHRYDPEASKSEPCLHRAHAVKEFADLSCLSTNCTDDFLLASGVSSDIAMYDVQAGVLVQRACGIHDDAINTIRFCNRCPHIFATASFDHTCKIWDLRRPVTGGGCSGAVRSLNTGGQNVMCTFSPDDTYLLCSGLDTHIVQFEVPSWRRTPDAGFSFREPVHSDRFRRVTYLAGGHHFATAATEEAHVDVVSVEGRNLGSIDFKSHDPEWPLAEEECSSGSNSVFVQSVRAHPVEQDRFGVLLWPQAGTRSCVALVDLLGRRL
jgi:WD40 repeat protein